MPDDVHAAARVDLKGGDPAPHVNRSRTRAGAVLIFAAVTFWLAWVFMPGAGTNDAAHTLDVVREQRPWVFLSVAVQIISSIAFVPAVLLISQLPAGAARRLVLAGGTLLLIGAGGMCADAIFHLAAYSMTTNGVAPHDVYSPVLLLQNESILFLLLLLLAFFAGAIVLALGLQRAGFISTIPMIIFIAAISVAIAGGIPAALLDAGRYAVVLLFLGLFAAGLVRVGAELMRPRRIR